MSMTFMIKKSILMTILLAALTCGVYPGVVWVIGQLVFHSKANGSIIVKNGMPIGSLLIAQGFTKPEYFHPRNSAAGDKGFDGSNSGATNFSLTNKKYQDALLMNIKKVLAENPQIKEGQIPPDMVATSASGLDPHISILNAKLQTERIARARGVGGEKIRDLIDSKMSPKTIIGDGFVNVLELNISLDEKFPINIGRAK